MRNKQIITTAGLVVYTIVLVLTIITAIVTFVVKDFTNLHPLIIWAVSNHLLIMILMLVLSIGYGFFGAWYLYSQLKKEEKNTKSILEIVLLFLSSEEKIMLFHLLERNGKSTQAEIARIKDFGNVKAMRLVNKMQDKQLVTVSARGKVRDVYLKENIKELLAEEKSN